MPTNSTRKKTSYRFSDRTRECLQRLKTKLEISETSVIEMAIQRMAIVELSERGAPPGTLLDAAVAFLKLTLKQ